MLRWLDGQLFLGLHALGISMCVELSVCVCVCARARALVCANEHTFIRLFDTSTHTQMLAQPLAHQYARTHTEHSQTRTRARTHTHTQVADKALEARKGQEAERKKLPLLLRPVHRILTNTPAVTRGLCIALSVFCFKRLCQYLGIWPDWHR